MHQNPPQDVHRVDGLVRMALWGVTLVVLVQQLTANGSAPPTSYILPLVVILGALAGYLLLSIPSIAHTFRQRSDAYALLIAVAPLVVILPYALNARQDPEFDPSILLSTAMLLFLPVSCALLNTAALRRGDIAMGLVTVALPLVAPLIRNESITTPDGILRLGALALPVLLLVLTTRTQRQRLNFLFICAVLSLWYSVQFHAWPDFVVPNTDNLQYFEVVLLPLLLLVLALSDRFTPLGLSFRPSAKGAGTVALGVLLAAVVLVPLGLAAGVLHVDSAPLQSMLSAGWSGPGGMAAGLLQLLNVFLFVALPQELLFRGSLLTYLRDMLGWPVGQVIAVSSLLFGLAHLHRLLDAGFPTSEFSVPGTIGLGVLAGVIYALVFVARKNVTAAAAVHALADWIGGLLFHF